MEMLVSLIVQLVTGAVGGVGTARAGKNVDLGNTGNTIAGAIGGVATTWLATYIPGLAGMVGNAGGTLDIGMLVGQAVTGLVGGGVLTAIVGAIKNSMAKA